MRAVVFTHHARSDLRRIMRFIARRSRSKALAETFIAAALARCHRMAVCATEVGRPRPDIGPAYRSLPFGRYLIIHRYEPDRLVIVRILSAYLNADPNAIRAADDDPDDA